MEAHDYHNWEKFEGNKIPSSLELYPIIYKYLKSDFKILDVGSGFGKTCFELAAQGYNIVGIDINKTGIEWANNHLKALHSSTNPSFLVMDALNMNFPDDSFDFQIWQALLTTIIGLDKRRQLFRECSRVLKSGGFIYMAVFGQTWHSDKYYKKYIEGYELTKEEGSFPSYNKKTGSLEYIAHHYTEKELAFLIKEVDLKILHYEHQFFTTRGGNRVNGHVIILTK